MNECGVRKDARGWSGLRGRGVGLSLMIVSVLFVTVMVGMVALVASSSPPVQLDMAWVETSSNFVLYRLGFVCASLIAPVFIVVLVLLVAVRPCSSWGVRDLLGVLFLAVYAPLSSLAYTSQYVLLPRLLDGEAAVAASWYFHDSHSIPYFMDLLGYTFFGIAAVFLAFGFLAHAGVWRWLGGVLLASGLASILAFAVLGAQLETTHMVLSVSSAVLTLPIAVMAFVVGRDLRGKQRLEHAESTRPVAAGT